MNKLFDPRVANPSFITPVDTRIEAYQQQLAQIRDEPVLLQMEALAQAQGFPIVGRLVGLFLEVMAKSIGARRIFEFGSGYGYSAYWFARAAGERGRVICSDADPKNAAQAEEFLAQAGLWERVDFRVGIAQECFHATSGEFDICYNDVDKDQYPEVWQLARGRIRRGGLYICDNVLWHGRVVATEPVPDIKPGWTEAIREHNRMIFDDPDFDCFINPTRDGVLVARRK
ncbi:MAG: O-methyltransferase [Pseudomonadota bacterium]